MGSSTTLNLMRSAALAGLFGVFPAGLFAQRCPDMQVLIKGGFGEARFTIELADEPAERAQGLMHRESMAAFSGMLFIFEQSQPVAFWMKNTLIPLDIIFTDATGQVIHIHKDAIPHDETPIPGGESVYAVLEINAGISEKFGFKVGDALQHPAFSGGPAIFPCKE